RLPEKMIDVLKEIADRHQFGYQTLIKQWLDERIRHEAEAALTDGGDSRHPQLQSMTERVLGDALAGLEQKLSALDQRLASVEDLEAKILDRVGVKTGS